jgi:carboxylesterase type B
MGWMEGTYKLTEPGAQKFASYEGIPYAMPPIERLRFKPPMKDNNFYKSDKALQATKPASDCPQLDPLGGEYKGSEDCLYLNVFTPQLESMPGSEQLPVMVWIHGGTFQFGSGSSEQYGPERLLDKGVVVVTLNYRLGALGFLTTGDLEAPPNVGLMDQLLALRWVRDHVSAFGGDPERVTLFGGGISVTAHLASPYSRGLFQQAIAMSGVWGEVPVLHKSEAPATYATKLAAGLGCDTSEGSETSIADCLRTKSPKDILTQAATFRTFSAWPEPFTPTVDGYMENPMLPQPLHKVWDGQVSEFSLVPLMIGGTQHEGIMALVDFLQDETRLAKFNENFATEGPALLLGVDPVADPGQRDEGETATAEVLRSNYLGEETQFMPSNREALVQLLSDVHVLGPVDRTVRQLAATKAPLYYYSYRHQGSFSVPMALGIWEVSIVDENNINNLCPSRALVSATWMSSSCSLGSHKFRILGSEISPSKLKTTLKSLGSWSASGPTLLRPAGRLKVCINICISL